MSIPFYAKSEQNQGYIKNMEVVGYHDLNKMMAFQMALHKTEDGRYYLYCGSFYGAGWNILDVTDPAKPRHVKFFECCDPKEYKAQCTPKIQVADGLMIGRHRRRCALPPRQQARGQGYLRLADL